MCRSVSGGLKLFAAAERLAGDEAVRLHVEKASICAYRAAIEPSWNLKPSAKFDATLAAQQRPLVKRFFDLCKKYGVTQVSERRSVTERLKMYKQLFSLKETESL